MYWFCVLALGLSALYPLPSIPSNLYPRPAPSKVFRFWLVDSHACAGCCIGEAESNTYAGSLAGALHHHRGARGRHQLLLALQHLGKEKPNNGGRGWRKEGRKRCEARRDERAQSNQQNASDAGEKWGSIYEYGRREASET